MKEYVTSQTFQDGNKVWSVPRLIALADALPRFSIPLKHLNIYNMFPDIKTTGEFVEHMQYVLDANPEFPIIMDEEGYVMDGRHRILHALLFKHKSIKAVRFDKTPDCCYIKES